MKAAKQIYRKHTLDDQIRRVSANIKRLKVRGVFINTRKDKDAIKETIIFLEDIRKSLETLKTKSK